MAESASSESFRVLIGSAELALPAGSLAELDAEVSTLAHEPFVLRVASVLAGLAADRSAGYRNVSLSFAKVLGSSHPISKALNADAESLFLEPLQQLVLLRRALTAPANGAVEVWSDKGVASYLNACRYAADIIPTTVDPGTAKTEAEASVQVAANFLLRASLAEPPQVTNWIARMRLMLNELPKANTEVKECVQRLRDRIEFAFGLTFEEVATFVGLLSLWSMRFTKLEDVFSPKAGIALNPDSWHSQTTIDKEHLVKFFDRTALSSSASLSDAAVGGPTSILPFRDRPFIRFADGNIAPVHPALVLEKVTYDLFWWSGTLDKKQEHPWQRDWGELVEAYVVQVLAWIAAQTGCGFKADVRWDTKQIDAVMWFKGHVALFEISAAMLTDVAAHSGEHERLAAGLAQILVRSKNADGKVKDEAIAQVVRDAKALLSGELGEEVSVEPITRVYPVVIAIDRRVRTPPLRYWFDEAFESELGTYADRARIAPLAVWGLEDLEAIEQLVRNADPSLKGTPRGVLRLLRTWELVRNKLPKTGKRAAAWKHFIGHEVLAPAVNERLKAEADKWWAEVKQLFKKAAAGDAD